MKTLGVSQENSNSKPTESGVEKELEKLSVKEGEKKAEEEKK